jgi:hypothetical protein
MAAAFTEDQRYHASLASSVALKVQQTLSALDTQHQADVNTPQLPFWATELEDRAPNLPGAKLQSDVRRLAAALRALNLGDANRRVKALYPQLEAAAAGEQDYTPFDPMAPDIVPAAELLPPAPKATLLWSDLDKHEQAGLREATGPDGGFVRISGGSVVVPVQERKDGG